MFIKIDAQHLIYSEDNGNNMKFLENSYYLNLHKLIQIEFHKCLIDKRVADSSIKLRYLIKLYVLVDEGVWNFMTLYFTKESHREFQRIKNIIRKGRKMSNNDHKANQANKNKGTNGTNSANAKVHGNRGAQMNSNSKGSKGK